VLAFAAKRAKKSKQVTYIWVEDLFVVERAAPAREQQNRRSHVTVLSFALCRIGRARLKLSLVVLVRLAAGHLTREAVWRSAMLMRGSFHTGSLTVQAQ